MMKKPHSKVIEATFQAKKKLKKTIISRLNDQIIDNPFQVRITKEERQLSLRLVDTFDRVMRRHSIDYFISGGLLIGSYRYHNLVPWDDDLDVYMNVSHEKTLPRLFANESDIKFFSTGFRDKLSFNLNVSGAQKTPNRPWNWPYLDIAYVYEKNNKVHTRNNEFGVNFHFPRHFIYPLIRRPVANYQLLSPNNPQAFLRYALHGSTCNYVVGAFSHQLEGYSLVNSKSVKSQSLAGEYPFVQRTVILPPSYTTTQLQLNFSQPLVVNESLVFRQQVLDWKVIRNQRYTDENMEKFCI